MADNIVLSTNIGTGATIRTDDDGTAHWQYVKLAFGADNTQTIVGSTASNPLPVALSDTDNAVLDSIQTAVEIIDNPVLVDDAAFTPATSSVMMAGFEFDDTTPDSVDEGDAGAARMSARREVYVQIRDAAGNERGLNIDASNRVAVDASGVAVPVTDNSGSLTVDNGGTFAVQVDAALPTGSNTIGDVTVSGDALTALQLIDDVVATLGTTTYTETTTKGAVIGAVRNDTLAALANTDNEVAPLQVNASGALYIQEGAALDVSAATVTVDLGANNDVTIDNSSIVKAEDTAHNTGDAGVMALAVRKDTAAALAGADADYHPLEVDANGRLHTIDVGINTALSGNELQVDIVGALPTGTNSIGKLAANSGVDIGDVDILSIAAGSNLIGDVGLQGRTSGGLTIFRSIDLDESEEEIKATAGQVYTITAFNLTAAPLYLKFYNATAATVVVGTTTPVMTFPIPGNADSDGAGFVLSIPQGIEFGTAITVACTTGIADADTGAPGANECIVNILYE